MRVIQSLFAIHIFVVVVVFVAALLVVVVVVVLVVVLGKNTPPQLQLEQLKPACWARHSFIA